jgi:DNA-binding NarL/FixJ family response regulator
MPPRREARPRVLLANLAPMVRLGMARVLADDGVDVLDDNAGRIDVVAEAKRLCPDAVVLGLEHGLGRELGAGVRAAAPATKVILWPRDEDEMEVFDPGHRSARRVAPPLREALLGELGITHATSEGN